MPTNEPQKRFPRVSECCKKEIVKAPSAFPMFEALVCSQCNNPSPVADEGLPEKEESKEIKDTGKISDGYHTFDELYEHRFALFIALCRAYNNQFDGTHEIIDGKMVPRVWRSKLQSDGNMYPGWFIAGINHAKGEQITYHLPLRLWIAMDDFHTLEKAPEFDGHTSQDVITRLLEIL